MNTDMTALVVDDSKAIRMILRRILAGVGFSVVEAANGRVALEQVQTHRSTIQLMLVDWNMPEMSGLEFIRAVRARADYARIPIIMVTTETEQEQMMIALESGASEYVMKPFTEDMIAGKMNLLGVRVSA